MDKNFRVRTIVGLVLFAVSLAAIYAFEAIPFKIFFGIFAAVSAIELFSFFYRRTSWLLAILALIELLFLIGGVVFVATHNVWHFWYVILGVPGYDVFAYLSGKVLGGKIFKKSRPFPHISKNKTWEGTFFGLLIATVLVASLMAARGAFSTDFVYLFCGPLALVGDLFESFLKRKFNVKDSNEIVIKNDFFKKLEVLVGGSEGHGGFLDRIDSSAFATTILLMIGLIA